MAIQHTVTGFVVWSQRISDDLVLPCAIVFDGGITLARESETKKDYARDFFDVDISHDNADVVCGDRNLFSS